MTMSEFQTPRSVGASAGDAPQEITDALKGYSFGSREPFEEGAAKTQGEPMPPDVERTGCFGKNSQQEESVGQKNEIQSQPDDDESLSCRSMPIDTSKGNDPWGETSKQLGKRGEDAAARYLEHMGYEILARNWCCRYGEADIIALDPDGELCFVEVKTRRSIEAGLPEEAITEEKRARYERIAMSYIVEQDELEPNIPIHFDCIGICVPKGDRALLRHHRNAFNG